MAAAIGASAPAASAQSLNWDGQTGALVTPFATVAPSRPNGFGRPLVAFDMLAAGPIVGLRFQLSFTAGVAERVEMGYTKSAVSGETDGLATLFDRGFQNVHGKVRLVGDNRGSGVPAIAIGVRFAWQVSSLTEAEPLRTTDVYIAATKSFAAADGVVVLINGGVKFTNAALLSLGGNAADWCVCFFGTGEVSMRDKFALGAEVLQQPQEIELLGTADIPPTFTAYARVTPVANRLSFLIAYVRLAGVVAPDTDLQALNQFAWNAVFRF